MRAAVAAAALLVKTAALSMAARGLPLQPSNKVVILGGGLQGCASAYYLKQRGFEDVTIVERTSVAAAASGKGGGFLARGWGSGPTRALHEVSFDLHAELAKTLNLKTYRKIKTLSVTGELQCMNQIVAARRSASTAAPDSLIDCAQVNSACGAGRPRTSPRRRPSRPTRRRGSTRRIPELS